MQAGPESWRAQMLNKALDTGTQTTDAKTGVHFPEGGRDQTSGTREMPNFRVNAQDQDQIIPKGNTESQSCFISSA